MSEQKKTVRIDINDDFFERMRATKPAIRHDEEWADAIDEDLRCTYCGGTGNELYSMYRQCRACGGDGVSRGNEADFGED